MPEHYGVISCPRRRNRALPHCMAPLRMSPSPATRSAAALASALANTALNRVTAIEAVSAGGEQLRVDAKNKPDLFWALRGGGGSFGVVTAFEFDLLPLREIFAGALLFPPEQASEVLQRAAAHPL